MNYESDGVTGESVGIHFKYGGKVANTVRPHRLVHYAQQHGKQDEVQKFTSIYDAIVRVSEISQVMTELFADYHERERNIGSIDVRYLDACLHSVA